MNNPITLPRQPELPDHPELPEQVHTPAQPDPPQDLQPALALDPPHRIPNLGHALLFLALAGILLVLFQGLILLGKHPLRTHDSSVLTVAPKLLLASMAATYLTTLFASSLLFPRLWQRPFFNGLQWHWPTARRQALRLIPVGFALAVTAQAALYYLTPPKILPIEEMFASASDAWLTTAFGILLAPAFEEICFRGFLLPAFAIAYDWLALARTPEAHARWKASTTLSPLGLVFSAILSSLCFALLHGQQVAHLVPALAVLFCVSLVLSFIRIKTRSVACSTLVHAAYNGFVFVAVIVQTGGYRHLERLHR